MRSNDEIVTIIEDKMKEDGLSLSELARRVGMAKSAISRYFNRTREFPLNRINEFSNVLDLDPKYILGFEDQSDIQELYDKLTPPRQRKVYTYAEQQLEEQRNVIDLQEIKESSTQFVTGRRTAAGSALYVDDTDARHDVLPSSLVPKGADELVEVVGDSMEPLIHNGEHVYIRYQPQVECGEVAIVRIEDEGVTCKRVYIDGDKVKLRSENDAYDDMIFNADQITILGKVLI